VVATGRGGSAEYLRDEYNCLLFDADDAEALAAALTRLGSDEALRARLRRGGLETAPKHTDEIFNKAVEEELSRAAGPRSSRALTTIVRP
jgi:glycosyltransferase involved in cell wall biosynthesis